MSLLDVKTAPYLYIAPFFIVWAITGLFPLLYTAYISTRKWDLLQGDLGPAGLSNFTFVLAQPGFWQALRNTFSIFLLSSVPQIITALFLAAVLDANLRAKTFWRMGVLIPYVVAPVAVSLIFTEIFSDRSGMANALLANIGVSPIGWHADTLPSHLAIATMVNYRWTGYNTLILLAAMQSISTDVIEAAVVDGAVRLKTYWYVILPLLRPTVIFVIITSTIGGLQIFDEPRMFDLTTIGGSNGNFMTVTMYLYNTGWGPQLNMGRASAVAMLLLAVILLVALFNLILSSRISSVDNPSGRHGPGRKTGVR
ncbi:carbohydrate ABC transporter permease [Propionibacterium cyclohexanicum]|nr:sugar ABC transporter permease [Propionibacterium cyclohexanicum]